MFKKMRNVINGFFEDKSPAFPIEYTTSEIERKSSKQLMDLLEQDDISIGTGNRIVRQLLKRIFSRLNP